MRMMDQEIEEVNNACQNDGSAREGARYQAPDVCLHDAVDVGVRKRLYNNHPDTTGLEMIFYESYRVANRAGHALTYNTYLQTLV